MMFNKSELHYIPFMLSVLKFSILHFCKGVSKNPFSFIAIPSQGLFLLQWANCKLTFSDLWLSISVAIYLCLPYFFCKLFFLLPYYLCGFLFFFYFLQGLT